MAKGKLRRVIVVGLDGTVTITGKDAVTTISQEGVVTITVNDSQIE